MKPEKLIPITDPDDIPSGMSKEEEAKFWETHWVTEEYINKTKEQARDVPQSRTRTISIRFDEDVLQQLKSAAKEMRKGYQTLLKEFVVEGLGREAAAKFGAIDAQSLEVPLRILDELKEHRSALAELQKAVQTPHQASNQESLTTRERKQLEHLRDENRGLHERIRQLELEKRRLRSQLESIQKASADLFIKGVGLSGGKEKPDKPRKKATEWGAARSTLEEHSEPEIRKPEEFSESKALVDGISESHSWK